MLMDHPSSAPLQRDRSRSPRRRSPDHRDRARSPRSPRQRRRSYSPRSRSRSRDDYRRRSSRSPMSGSGHPGGYSGSGYAGSGGVGGPRRSYEERAAAKDAMMQSLRDSSQQDRRVYVGNLSYDVKWHHLKDFMRQGGFKSSLFSFIFFPFKSIISINCLEHCEMLISSSFDIHFPTLPPVITDADPRSIYTCSRGGPLRRCLVAPEWNVKGGNYCER